MAIGVVTDEEFESELSGYDSAPAAVVDLKKGRGEQREVPSELRKVIGADAAVNGHKSGTELAARMGISESSVSAYQNGATSTARMDNPDDELKSHVDEEKGRVARIARDKLTLAINAISEEKLKDASPRVASGVAKDMASVVKDMEPEQDREDKGPTFVFFTPPPVKEDRFKVIDVRD